MTARSNNRCPIYFGIVQCIKEEVHVGPHDFRKLVGGGGARTYSVGTAFTQGVGGGTGITKYKCRKLTQAELAGCFLEVSDSLPDVELSSFALVLVGAVSRAVLLKFCEVNGLDYKAE